MTLAPEYINEPLRMPWPEICNMACAAMIRSMTIDQFVEAAMRYRLKEAQ